MRRIDVYAERAFIFFVLVGLSGNVHSTVVRERLGDGLILILWLELNY